MKNLTLYYFPACPFCQKVLRFMSEHHLDLELKDIRLDSKARDELLRIGGKTQVPCLVIDGKALYESGDIIAWLKAKAL